METIEQPAAAGGHVEVTKAAPGGNREGRTTVDGAERPAAKDGHLKYSSRSKYVVQQIIKRAKRLNRTHAVHPNRYIYDNAEFPWVAEVEREWRLIRKELDLVLTRKSELADFHEVMPDARRITSDSMWKTYYFLGYGVRSERNIEACPETWRILQKVPGLKTAMFSILEPGKHLPAHKGPYNGVLRFHLGLIVPEPRDKVTLRVVDQRTHWEEGKGIVFDDSYEHEVWNDTDGVRVVLFLDIVKPLRFPANLVNWMVINLAPFTPFVRESSQQQKKWEGRFYGKAA